jgi:hypothetical protein
LMAALFIVFNVNTLNMRFFFIFVIFLWDRHYYLCCMNKKQEAKLWASYLSHSSKKTRRDLKLRLPTSEVCFNWKVLLCMATEN